MTQSPIAAETAEPSSSQFLRRLKMSLFGAEAALQIKIILNTAVSCVIYILEVVTKISLFV